MADSTSKITPPDTTPAGKEKAGNELDDWSSVLDSLGDIQQAGDNENSGDEPVGDLSALDEAIAELDQASEAISTAVSEIEFDIPDEDIPLLKDSVAVLQPERQAQSQALDQDLADLSPSSIIQASDILSPPEEAEKDELLSELEVIAQDLTTPAAEADATADGLSEPSLSQFEAGQVQSTPLEITDEEEMLLAGESREQAESEASKISESGFQPSTIETKQAVSDTDETSISAILGDAQVELGTETEASEESSALSDFSDSELEQLPSLIDSQAATEMVDSEAPIQDGSGFAEADTEQAQHSTIVPPVSPAASDFGSDLHAALSKRIDTLVTEAIESLNEELHAQLAKRMEDLLVKAVDQAMPTLMEQLAAGLRQEVQQHIQQELPQIVSNMLGQIRLDKG